MPPNEQAFGNSAKEKLPFSTKKAPAEPDSQRGSHLPQPGGEGRKTGQQDILN